MTEKLNLAVVWKQVEQWFQGHDSRVKEIVGSPPDMPVGPSGAPVIHPPNPPPEGVQFTEEEKQRIQTEAAREAGNRLKW